MPTLNRIMISMAMLTEAQPLIEKLGLKPSNIELPGLPAQIFSGMVNGQEIFLVTNGQCPIHKVDRVATQAAAVTTYAAIQALNPDIIINAGTAGGFAVRGGKIGDVYLGEKVMYHDRHIPFGNFKAYGEGSYAVVPTDFMMNELHLKKGVISTGNSLDAPNLYKERMAQYQAHIKEMEAAAIIEVAMSLKKPVPVVFVKSLTDIVDQDHTLSTADQFESNFKLAVDNLAEKTVQVVQFMAGQTLEYLATGENKVVAVENNSLFSSLCLSCYPFSRRNQIEPVNNVSQEQQKSLFTSFFNFG